MDIYTATTRIVAEVLALSHGLLGYLVNLPSNASGPLDPNATLTAGGSHLVQHMAAAGVNAANILCDMFEALF
jgi:hypothetical protein